MGETFGCSRYSIKSKDFNPPASLLTFYITKETHVRDYLQASETVVLNRKVVLQASETVVLNISRDIFTCHILGVTREGCFYHLVGRD